MRFFIALLIVIAFQATTSANGQQDGFAIIKNDTVYGEILINFSAGSIIVKQDSINRMFLSNIELVTLLNKKRDTYFSYLIDGKNTFYKAIVQGDNPLIEKDGVLFCVSKDHPAEIEEKVLYQLFGKKNVKDYVFVRNISLDERGGVIDLFRYFNNFHEF